MPEETTTSSPTTTILCPTTTVGPYDEMQLYVSSLVGEVPHTVTVSLSDYCPYDFIQYVINYGDTINNTIYNTLSNAYYTYYNDGSYIITLSAVKVNGEVVLKNTAVVEVNQPQIIDSSSITVSDQNGKVPHTVDIDFEPDGELDHESIEINYGDGTSETVDKKDFDNISHTYTKPGLYVITIVATDKDGTNHVYYYSDLEITVDIDPNAPNGGGGGGGGQGYSNTTTGSPPTNTTPKVPTTPSWVTTTVCECYPPVPTTPDRPPPFTLPTTVPSTNAGISLTTPPPVDPLTPSITTTTTTTTTTVTTTTTTTIIPVIPQFEACKANCNSLNY